MEVKIFEELIEDSRCLKLIKGIIEKKFNERLRKLGTKEDIVYIYIWIYKSNTREGRIEFEVEELNYEENIDIKVRAFLVSLQNEFEKLEKNNCRIKIVFSSKPLTVDKSIIHDNSKSISYRVQEPLYSFDKIILPQSTKTEIMKTLSLIEKNIYFMMFGDLRK
ncbi:hypothetical protein [Aquifex sp.]